MFVFSVAMAALFLAAAVPPSWAAEELDVAWVRIEINATAGDVGLHLMFDGGPWKEMEVKTPKGRVIYEVEVAGPQARRGGTENFNEGAEPPCEDQPLAEFLKRFPPGTYKFRGTTIDGKVLKGEFDLSHDLPAAPKLLSTLVNGPVVIRWEAGENLGGCHDADLIPDVIPAPAGVPVDSWEVVVEPDVEDSVLEMKGLKRLKFTAQLAPGQTSVTVSPEYVQPYVAAGIKTFKFEVGAHGEGTENQTFSEGTFAIP